MSFASDRAHSKIRILLFMAVAAMTALTAVLVLPGAALAANTRIVRYRGVEVKVPTGWPVFNLRTDPSACVRFNRHAVYLGTPGANENCPIAAIGRTEAILISPSSSNATVAGRGALTPVSASGAAPGGGSMVRIAEKARHVVITATWDHDPQAIRTALGLRSLRAAVKATNGHRPAAAKAAAPSVRERPRGATGIVSTTTTTTPTTTTPTTTTPTTTTPTTTTPTPTPTPAPTGIAATPGEVYTGDGFDTCEAPSLNSMSAWSASPYRAVGIYIGGTNMGCAQANLNAAWVSTESAAGWHLIPTYVGLQAPTSSCTKCSLITAATAASDGTAAAQDAVVQAQALGIGTGNPIYFDMEGYTRTTASTAAVLAFLEAWTQQLNVSGYASGVYSSAGSGMVDLSAQVGTSYVEPDDIWIADWNDPGTSTSDPYVPSLDWSTSNRLLQYAGGNDETYDAVKLDVDNDYLDGLTAAAGIGPTVSGYVQPPTLSVSPQANGVIDLTPKWTGETGVTSVEILAGNSQTALTEVETISATRALPVVLNDVYDYFQVQTLNATGQVISSSAVTATPSSVAVYGNSAFVPPAGSFDIPAACVNASSSCQLTASVYDGKKRLTQTAAESVSRYGGVIRVSLSTSAHKLVAAATGRRLPVTVKVTGAGATVSRSLKLVPYETSGTAPERTAKGSAALRVLSKTSFVSNAWTGGVLVACTSNVPCVATTRVTRGGVSLAAPRTQTIGAGEVGYLGFKLNNKGHALLKQKPGNQLGARVTITTRAETLSNGAVATVASSGTAMALVSLDSFR